MKKLFKFGVKIVTNKMRKHDLKVKSSLPRVEGVNKYLSLKYVDDLNDEYRKFNVYRPKDESKIVPTIIDIHGGGWVYGDKDLNEDYAMYLASKGYNTLTFSYRLLTMTNLKGMVQDIFTFFNYVYENKEKLRLDFNHVAISGDSAGAHLALLTLAINNSKELMEKYEVKGFPFNIDFLVLEHPCPFIDEVFEPKNFINKMLNKQFIHSLYDPFKENLTLKETSSLDKFIKYANYPPILVVSATNDDLIRFYQKTLETFDKYGINYETRLYEGLYHVFEILDYTLKESKEFNDYSLEKFNEIIIRKENAK